MISKDTHANAKNPYLYNKIVDTVNGATPVLDFLDFMPVNNDTFKYNRQGTMPGIAFRDYNQEYAENTGVINPAVEYLRMFGGDSDIDVKMMEANGGIPYREAQDVAKAKSQGMFFQNQFFVGDSQGDTVLNIDGLRTRLTGGQVIDAGATDGGDELTLDMVDELILAVAGQKPDVIFCNMKMILKINRLIRAANQASEPVSGNFGRIYRSYAGIPLAQIETFEMDDPASPGTPITLDPLGFNEPDLDTGTPGDKAVTCSMYAVRFGKGEYVSGLQTGAFDVEDCGKLPGSNKMRTKLDWMAGLALFHPKSAARLRGLKDA